jgi:hypothetical protein
MRTIKGRDIRRQLIADLIGKDSHRGVTLTYTWLANQFGHFSLGFIPTSIIYAILNKCHPGSCSAICTATLIAAFWLLFELYNFLGPLLFTSRSRSKLFFVKGAKYIFSPDWSNIAFDTFTDVCFFAFGAFFASIFLDFSWCAIYVLIALFIILIYPSRYWFLTKMYLQAAQYPFQLRLCQWNCIISAKAKETVNLFLDSECRKHLFVFGGMRSGKTALSVGIATELSIKHEPVLYTTAMKLYTMFFQSHAKMQADNKALWTWRNASLLVIDDINPGDPVEHDLVTPGQFLHMLDTNTTANCENRKTIRDKNVIWVMGDEEQRIFEDWKKILVGIGVDEKDIHVINLHFRN